MSIKRQANGEYTFSFFGESTATLAIQLLLQSQQVTPRGYRLLDEVKFELRYPDRSETVPYVRLYKIEPDARRTTSVGE